MGTIHVVTGWWGTFLNKQRKIMMNSSLIITLIAIRLKAQDKIFRKVDNQLKKQQIQVDRFIFKDKVRTRSTYPDHFFGRVYVGVDDVPPLARIQ